MLDSGPNSLHLRPYLVARACTLAPDSVEDVTVILRYAGFTIRTDPNFLHRGDHVHLGHGMTATRLTDPALEMEALPPVDFVVLTHMHEDHFDREVGQKLDRGLPMVTTSHAAADLTSKGFRAAKALDTWETLTVTKGSARVRITSTPGAHGPGFLAKMPPDVMGSLLEFENARGGSAFRIYIAMAKNAAPGTEVQILRGGETYTFQVPESRRSTLA